MRIGELAKACDCSVETIRYYEQIGLLSKPRRADNGYRIYLDEHKKWLQFIRRSRQLGLSQNEIRLLVDIAHEDSPACEDVQRLLSGHLRQVKQKILELKQLEEALTHLQSRCDKRKSTVCPAIAELLT